MTARTTGAAFVIGIVVAGIGGSAARPATANPPCQNVRVTGGDYNGMTGGVLVAQVLVENDGRRACEVVGRPWIRLPRLPHPVTVADISSGWAAGTPSGRILLSPGKRAVSAIWLVPGRCDRSRDVVFPLAARAGWAKGSVRIAGSMCDDGSGQIRVSTFRHARR